MAESIILAFTLTLPIIQFSYFLPSFAQEEDEELNFGVLHTMHNLTAWANAKVMMAEKLKERLRFVEEEMRLIKRFLADYKDSTGKAMDHLHDKSLNLHERGRVVGSSYLLGHRMTSRLCGVIKNLRTFLRTPEYVTNQRSLQDALTFVPEAIVPDEITISENEQKQDKANNSSGSRKGITGQWPDWQDKYMSLNSLITLDEVLGLSPDQLVKGLTLDTAYGGHLTPEKCVEVGMFALAKEKYDIAVDWLEYSIQLQLAMNMVRVDIIRNLLMVAVQEHNRKWIDSPTETETFELDSTNLAFFVHPITKLQSPGERKRLNMRQNIYFKHHGLGQGKLPLVQHIDICMGNFRQTPETEKSFYCYYENKRHPYLYINPVKAEVLSESPPIIQFYEMLGNSTMERIKELSKHYMSLSELVAVDTTDWDTITTFRTSVSSALDHEDIPSVYKLAEIVSGLDVINASAPTQVIEYTYGRHYTAHSDVFTEEEMSDTEAEYYGERLATMLYYIEVPAMGGETSFCQAGRSAYPERGSAVLWFSMYRNGTLREDVDHGACPVIHGHKIAINHWIRYMGNLNQYKCSLNQFE